MSEDIQAPGEDVQLCLTSDQALVLFELLFRWSEEKHAPTPGPEMFDSPAECSVLHTILGQLESALVEPFQLEYLELLNRARERLLVRWSGKTLRS